MRDLINTRFPVYARYCLLIAAFLTPVAFRPATFDVFNLTKITVFWIFGLLAFGLWLISAVERGVWGPRMLTFIPIGTFLAAASIATVFSISRTVSIIGMSHRYGGLVSFFLYATAFVAVVGLYWERPEEIKNIARAIAAATMIVAAYALIQKAGWDWNTWIEPGGGEPNAPFSTMGNSNFGGGYLAVGTPVLLYGALSVKSAWGRRAFLAITGIALFGLWLTQSRGAMIAVAAGLAAMGFVYRDRLPRWLRIGGIAFALLGTLLAVLVVFHPGTDAPPGPLRKVAVLGTDTLQARQFFWGAAWRMMLDKPLTGVGPDAYYAAYPSYRSVEDGATLGIRIADKPHNIYLENGATSGVFGVASLLALAGLVLWHGYRQARRADGEWRLLLTGLLGGVTAYFSQGFFSIDVPPLASTGWILMGALAACADPAAIRSRAALEALLAENTRGGSRRARGKRTRKNKRLLLAVPNRTGVLRWPAHMLVSSAIIALLFFGLRFYLADTKVKQGSRLRSSEFKKKEDFYQEAIRFNPWEGTYRSALGRTAEGQVRKGRDKSANAQWLARSIAYHEDALRLQPNNVFTMVTIARLYARWGNEIDPEKFDEAEKWLQKTMEHDPTNYDLRLRLAVSLDAKGRVTHDDKLRRQAAEDLEEVAQIAQGGGKINVWVQTAKILLELRDASAEDHARAKELIDMVLKADPDHEDAKKLLTRV